MSDSYMCKHSTDLRMFSCAYCERDDLKAELSKIRTELVQAQDDKARLDWLDASMNWRRMRDWFGMGKCTWHLRPAIDAAMKEATHGR